MQTPVRRRRAYRGRHQVPVLATFRPTWGQAVAGGAVVGAAGSAALALVAALADGFAARAGDVGVPPENVWLAVPAPLVVGVVAGLATGRRPGVVLDPLGMHRLPAVRDGFTPWRQVLDVRTERRRRRTAVVVYLRDGSAVRLPAPYHGGLLGRDPGFERKLFTICHLWETHRTRRSRR